MRQSLLLGRSSRPSWVAAGGGRAALLVAAGGHAALLITTDGRAALVVAGPGTGKGRGWVSLLLLAGRDPVSMGFSVVSSSPVRSITSATEETRLGAGINPSAMLRPMRYQVSAARAYMEHRLEN
jgi:hypothetical protein